MKFIKYKHNNKPVPRVSSILALISKPQLVPWANKMGLKGINTSVYVKHTANIGTLVHEAIEHHLMLDSDDKLDEILNLQTDPGDSASILYGFNKYLKWREGKDITEVQCEIPLTCELYGGTIDIYCKLDGLYTLIDIKTSSAIYDTHRMQVCAYRALLLNNNYPVDKISILRCGVRDDSEAEFVDIDKIHLRFNLFTKYFEIWGLNKELKK